VGTQEHVSLLGAGAASALGLRLEGTKGTKAPAPNVAVFYGLFGFSHGSCDRGAHVKGDA